MQEQAALRACDDAIVGAAELVKRLDPEVGHEHSSLP